MEENMNVEIVEKVNKSDKNMESIYDMASVVVSAILTVGIIFAFLFKISTVSGESMENTLHNGDKLIISAITQDVKYGDVVVTSQPNGHGKVLIKCLLYVLCCAWHFIGKPRLPSKTLLLIGTEIYVFIEIKL